MREAWQRTRPYFLGAVAIFVLGLILGWSLPYLPGNLGGQLQEKITAVTAAKFAPILRRIREAGPVGGVLIVLANNARAAALTVALGVTLIFPALSIFTNGIVAGFVLSSGVADNRLSLLRALGSVLPHGIFELPALFLAAALGCRFGLALWRRLLGRPVPDRLAGDLGRLGLLTLVLLAVAAVVEIFVSSAFSPRPLF